MAKIALSNGGFTLIPEDVYVFKITEVEYKEDFGKMTVTMQTKNGLKHTEKFNLIKANGEVNEGALRAFSYFAKTALNNFNLDEIDHTDIIGCYVQGAITHEVYEYVKDGQTKTGKSAHLGDYDVASGFEGAKATSEVDTDEDELDDLDDLDDLD